MMMTMKLLISMFCFIYRGAVDENNEQFVAYFLPTEETLTKRKRDSEEGVDYNAEDEYVFTDRTPSLRVKS